MASTETDTSELGKRLYALLREHGLPETATRFSVHVALGDAVRVDCDFLAYRDAEGGNTRR